MRPAIATVCLSGTLGEKLDAVAAAGFDGVEIFENDLLSFPGGPRDVRRMAEGLGLAIVAFQPFRDFEGMVGAARERVMARAERKFDLMGELGCDRLLVCSNVSPESLGGLDRAAADFHDLGERAAPRGIRVGYEALAWGRHVSDYRDAWEVVRRADHPSVGVILDSFHVLAKGTDLRAIRSIPGERITLVQLADAPRLDMNVLSWSRHHRCMPGQGDLDVAGFVEALSATGYDGPLSLEIFSDRFRAGSARAVAVDGLRSLLVLRDDLARRAGAAPTLPPRAVPHGVEFVEFAMDGPEADDFEALLRGLGFARAGRHLSKAVTRWRQGSANLVVNREAEGFAHAFHLTHGPAVCAVALRVEDAAAAVARATALLDQPFRQAVGPGELDIPAVRGLGGSLLHFTDERSGLGRLWDVDFEAVEDADARPAGITGFDHLAQAMDHEEALSWLLFYASLFELRKNPVQDLADPGGLVQSQALETADGALRLVLNASQSRRTLASRFLAEIVGSGVQHMALATEDLLGTMARLKANGVEPLPIPENYYDDLEARLDLAPGLLDRLRAAHALYDRDAGGEFLHAYTRTAAGGFFFEIVERRGYAGYGAVNAPIRLAAQTRLAAA